MNNMDYTSVAPFIQIHIFMNFLSFCIYITGWLIIHNVEAGYQKNIGIIFYTFGYIMKPKYILFPGAFNANSTTIEKVCKFGTTLFLVIFMLSSMYFIEEIDFTLSTIVVILMFLIQ